MSESSPLGFQLAIFLPFACEDRSAPILMMDLPRTFTTSTILFYTTAWSVQVFSCRLDELAIS